MFEDELPEEIADIDIFKLLDCPYCKFPAEVTHLVAYPQGSEMKYAFIAECFNQESYVISPEEIAGLD